MPCEGNRSEDVRGRQAWAALPGIKIPHRCHKIFFPEWSSTGWKEAFLKSQCCSRPGMKEKKHSIERREVPVRGSKTPVTTKALLPALVDSKTALPARFDHRKQPQFARRIARLRSVTTSFIYRLFAVFGCYLWPVFRTTVIAVITVLLISLLTMDFARPDV